MQLNLKHQFLSHEKEREEAQSYFLETFGLGKSRALQITVGPYKDASIELELTEFLKSKLKIADSYTNQTGLIFKKRTSEFATEPMDINEDSMSLLSNVYYDVILAFDVKVEVVIAG